MVNIDLICELCKSEKTHKHQNSPCFHNRQSYIPLVYQEDNPKGILCHSYLKAIPSLSVVFFLNCSRCQDKTGNETRSRHHNKCILENLDSSTLIPLDRKINIVKAWK